MSTEELVRFFTSGRDDPVLARKFVALLLGVLRKLVACHLASWGDAEDACGAVSAKLSAGAYRWIRDADPKPYVFVMALHELYRIWDGRRHEDPLPAAGSWGPVTPPSAGDTIDSVSRYQTHRVWQLLLSFLLASSVFAEWAVRARASCLWRLLVDHVLGDGPRPMATEYARAVEERTGEDTSDNDVWNTWFQLRRHLEMIWLMCNYTRKELLLVIGSPELLRRRQRKSDYRRRLVVLRFIGAELLGLPRGDLLRLDRLVVACGGTPVPDNERAALRGLGFLLLAAWADPLGPAGDHHGGSLVWGVLAYLLGDTEEPVERFLELVADPIAAQTRIGNGAHRPEVDRREEVVRRWARVRQHPKLAARLKGLATLARGSAVYYLSPLLYLVPILGMDRNGALDFLVTGGLGSVDCEPPGPALRPVLGQIADTLLEIDRELR